MPTYKPAAGRGRKTAAKKPLRKNEPLLNAVARKLGYVAGTLTHMAQGLAESLPAGRSGSVRSAAKHPKGDTTEAKKTAPRKKTASASARTPKTSSRTLRKKAASIGVARISRKRAVKN